MFPFNTFFASFSPFFLRNRRDTLSLGRGMGYYFSLWGAVLLLIAILSIGWGWLFVTPERALLWSEKIPPFSITLQDGVLIETGLPEDPFIFIDEKDFTLFVSKTLTEIPTDKQVDGGIFILKDRAIILQKEGVGQKEQIFTYADIPEVKNAHFDNILLGQKIVTELNTIKKITATFIAIICFFIGIMVAIWYCAWSFFWGFILWLISRTGKMPLTYEQSVGFVLFVFFPVSLISLLTMFGGIYIPFSMTILFILLYGYNHLSFYRSETKE